MATLQRMAVVVDRQNAGDPLYSRWRPASTAWRSRRPATWSSRAHAAERLYRVHPARAPARGEGRVRKARGFAPGPHQGALPLGGFQGRALTFLTLAAARAARPARARSAASVRRRPVDRLARLPDAGGLNAFVLLRQQAGIVPAEAAESDQLACPLRDRRPALISHFVKDSAGSTSRQCAISRTYCR